MRAHQKLHTVLFSVLGAGVAALLCSCGVPTPSQEDLDITVTARDPGYNFSAVKTYTLPTSVVPIQDPNSTTTPPTISSSLSTFVLNQVATHFNNAGYQQLTDTNGPKPDFFVEVSVMQTVQTDAYYSAWGGYYGAWYGGGYAYAPAPYGYVISSTLGSLILNLTNPNAPDPATQKIPTEWVAVLNGIIDGSSVSDIETRVTTGLNEAFNQSPYLKAGS